MASWKTVFLYKLVVFHFHDCFREGTLLGLRDGALVFLSIVLWGLWGCTCLKHVAMCINLLSRQFTLKLTRLKYCNIL